MTTDTAPIFHACIRATTSAISLLLEHDVFGAEHALQRAEKRLGELRAALPPHARQVRQATEALSQARRAAIKRADPAPAVAAYRACQRALG